MAGYIGSKASITQVDGYNRTEADAEFVQVAGDTMTGDLSFGDNDKAIFGAGSDLQLYHNGSNSYLDEVGTGHLFVRANNLRLSNADNSQYYLIADNSGFVKLNYAGATKLATTSTGVDVTGTITANALNGVTSSNTFKRVVQAGVVDDFTDYTTTTTSAYAAAGPFVSITPQSAGNTKLIGVFSADLRSSVSVNTTDAGTPVRLKYYNGSSYVNTGGVRTPLIASNLAGNVTLDQEISIPFQLNNSQRRSDTGDWLIRLYFSAQYANNTSTVYTGTVIFWEVDA
jgi:hypothetical protein